MNVHYTYHISGLTVPITIARRKSIDASQLAGRLQTPVSPESDLEPPTPDSLDDVLDGTRSLSDSDNDRFSPLIETIQNKQVKCGWGRDNC